MQGRNWKIYRNFLFDVSNNPLWRVSMRRAGTRRLHAIRANEDARMIAGVFVSMIDPTRRFSKTRARLD